MIKEDERGWKKLNGKNRLIDEEKKKHKKQARSELRINPVNKH